MAETEDAWKGLLGEGEAIFWQGRPSGRLFANTARIFETVLGLFIVAFALLWIAAARQASRIFWMFGPIILGVGLYRALYPIFIATLIRCHSFYTLTSQRAYIATDQPAVGRDLRSWKITPQSELELIQHRNGLGTITFFRKPGRRSSYISWDRLTGFELVEKAGLVFALMLQIQEEAR
ncbi:MAG: hypothetical protein ACK5LJ_14045 [Paracoccus sp. (in: a-proteobacteria)]